MLPLHCLHLSSVLAPLAFVCTTGNPPPGNQGGTEGACHSPSGTYYHTFYAHLLSLPSSGGLCIATGLYIIDAHPGANQFEQTRGPQAKGIENCPHQEHRVPERCWEEERSPLSTPRKPRVMLDADLWHVYEKVSTAHFTKNTHNMAAHQRRLGSMCSLVTLDRNWPRKS